MKTMRQRAIERWAEQLRSGETVSGNVDFITSRGIREELDAELEPHCLHTEVCVNGQVAYMTVSKSLFYGERK